jgi:ABC-type multidrug transport system permease subunit
MKPLNDLWVLVSRNLRVFVSDRANCLWAFLQVPLIAGLTVVAFAGFETDEHVSDYFARFANATQNYFEERDAAGEAPRLRSLTAWRLHEQTQKNSFQISAAAAQRRCGLYFVLVSAAIWFGIMSACREIVNEQHVLFRELRCCFGVMPYLAAKFLVLTLVVALQTALLVLLVGPSMLGLTLTVCLKLWGVLWLTAVGAVSLGLLLSSISPSSRVALTLVPLLMLPQLLFGGLLRPGPSSVEETPPPAIASSPSKQIPYHLSATARAFRSLALQRWGFEAALALDRYATNGVLSLSLSWPDPDPGRMLQPEEWMRAIKTRELSLVGLVFNDPENPPRPVSELSGRAGRLWLAFKPVIVLAGMVVVFLAGCYGTLRMRFL